MPVQAHPWLCHWVIPLQKGNNAKLFRGKLYNYNDGYCECFHMYMQNKGDLWYLSFWTHIIKSVIHKHSYT